MSRCYPQQSAAIADLSESEERSSIDKKKELQLIRKLERLSQISWSPTLRANSMALKTRVIELQRDSPTKKKRTS